MRLRGEMVVLGKSTFLSTKLSIFLLVTKNGRKSSSITLAKKTDLPSETSKAQQGRITFFPLKFSSKAVAQSAIGVFGLGFIDAGYSGDWSRIGVISKESEELLKVGAFIVVPLCLFLILNLSPKQEN